MLLARLRDCVEVNNRFGEVMREIALAPTVAGLMSNYGGVDRLL